jgi:hypothetical protein
VLRHSPNSLYKQLTRQIYGSTRELVSNLVLCRSLGPTNSKNTIFDNERIWTYAVRNEKHVDKSAENQNKCSNTTA